MINILPSLMVFGRLADLAGPSLSDSESDNLKIINLKSDNLG